MGVVVFVSLKLSFFSRKIVIFFLFMTQTWIFGAQWSHLIEMVLLSPRSLCLGHQFGNQGIHTPVGPTFHCIEWGLLGCPSYGHGKMVMITRHGQRQKSA